MMSMTLIFQLDGLIALRPKICEFQRLDATAENWTSCRCGRLQLSNIDRSRSLHLDLEQKNPALFLNLPVKSARTAKNRRFT